MAVACAIVVMILANTLIQSVFANHSAIVGQYIICRLTVGALTQAFGSSITCFLKSENRYFLILIRDLMI